MTVALEQLRIGDTFGAGWGDGEDYIDMWCQVQSVDQDKIVCEVLNGYWTLRVDRRTGSAVREATGSTMEHFRVLFTGYVPLALRREYNGVLEYMKERMTRDATPDEMALDMLAEVEGAIFDKQGNPRDVRALSSARIVDLITRSQAAEDVGGDTPASRALVQAREAVLMRSDWGPYLGAEQVDIVRKPVRKALGLSEFEPVEPVLNRSW